MQPNIVIFISDQQRTDTMACYGNHWIQSPHMNALSERSFVFENTYVTQAVCTPSRGSLMTGLYPHSHGCVVNNIELRDETKTIAEMLPDTYRKAHFGKWHLGNDAFCQHGFDEWASVEDGRKPRYTKPNPPFSTYHQWLVEQGFEPQSTMANGEKHFDPKQRATLPPECQMAAFVANQSDRFIRENTDQPWLLVFSTFEPHPPFTGPYDDLYNPDDLPVGPTFNKHPEDHSLFNRVRSDHFPVAPKDGNIVVEDLSTEAGWRKQRAQYFGNVKIIDDAVGKVVKALEETGQMENTIFAFTSDHGEMAGDHRMWEKRAFYEESARVPFLLSVPWLNTEQKRIDGVFGHADLVPTLLDLADQPIPTELEGQSLKGALTDDLDLVEHNAFVEWNGLGDRNLGNPHINLMTTLPRRCMVSGDHWKLTLCAGDQGELFDLNTDPHEQNNLFD
ncbi:MAG: sulfatase-like hydrolase/transferase, partial [Candidatus Latescibacteria bacterium]|nr:sulfatase-like hydrolase/transferase [Candidatus Latescibacterota bacterium]